MRVLVTNDDGVEGPGLHALAAAVAGLGHDVVVVAPTVDMSGAGASIGRMSAFPDLDAIPVVLPGAEGVPAYSLAGPPGMCVLACRLGALGDPPDLVVSGINPGCNTGRAVLHSGTVGAALTAANFGAKGLAVSIDMPRTVAPTDAEAEAETGTGTVAGGYVETEVEPEGKSEAEGPKWSTAAAFVARAVAWLVDAPNGTVLNVNAPDLPLDQVRGVRWASLAPFGTVRTTVVQPLGRDGGRLQLELRPGPRGTSDLPEDSDSALVKAGFVTITRLTGIQATDPLDPAEVFGPDAAEVPGTGGGAAP